ncbi:MAG: hemerythrin domain-containing protein [Armatimonadaceae bacterium]
MATLRPLDPPHKGIRNALAQLSLAAGSTAASDTAAVESLVTLCNDVLDFLDEHADFEEKYILEPLEERVPGAGADDHAAHQELETKVQGLRILLSSLTSTPNQDTIDAFYTEVVLFQALEEATTERLMMEHFSDEELIGHQIAIMGETSFESLLRMFRFIAPARRLDENLQVMQAFRANAPESAVTAVLATLQNAMPAPQYNALIDALG